MFPRKHKNKKVCWHSRKEPCLYIGLNVFFLLLMLLGAEKSGPVVALASVICFGGVAGFLTFQLFDCDTLFVTMDSDLGREIILADILKGREELGIFTYYADGFSYKQPAIEIQYKWEAIETVVAYKEDGPGLSSPCLVMFFADGSNLELTTGIFGLYQFIQRLEQQFLSIPAAWQNQLKTWTSAESLVILYDRKNRMPDEVRESLYTD